MKKIIDILGKTFLVFVCAWVAFAFSFEVFMIYVHFTDEEKEQRMATEFAWKFDGTYSNSPGNIWYKSPKTK
jgi:hypothetical protein